jgi:hypothetical protein
MTLGIYNSQQNVRHRFAARLCKASERYKPGKWWKKLSKGEMEWIAEGFHRMLLSYERKEKQASEGRKFLAQ